MYAPESVSAEGRRAEESAPKIVPLVDGAVSRDTSSADSGGNKLFPELLSIVKRTLGEEVSHDRPLFEMGLDSLSAIELSEQISNSFAISIEPTSIFDYPTIAELAGKIAADVGSTYVSTLSLIHISEPTRPY